MNDRRNVIDLGPANAQTYMETRRELLALADKLVRQIGAAGTVRTLEEMDRVLGWERDLKLVMEMVSSCSYVIDWLKGGRRPGNRRGIERLAGAQREVPTDPAKLWELAAPEPEEPKNEHSASIRVEAALRGLSERERDCFVLAQGECYSYADIAGLLRISKSSVSTYVARAQRKIANRVGGPAARVG